MEHEIIKIERYSQENEGYYKERLRTFRLPDEFNILPVQTFNRENKSVFLMTSEFPRKWFTAKKSRIIGYGIVEDVFDFSEEWQKYLIPLFNIPMDILQKYNIFISDFMISRTERKKGHGTELANHVLELYADKQICLHAVDDGHWFWIKMGFDVFDEENKIYVKCN